MSVLPDSSWINALKLPTQVMIGLCIASVVLLGLDRAEILVLADFGQLTKPLVVVLAVLSGSLAITGIGAFIKDQLTNRQKQSLLAARRELKLQEAETRRAKAESVALERIDHLSSQEIRHLAGCLRKGSQSFYTYVHSPSVTTLMGKGLVYTPGGTHNQDHYPFTISDFAWKALLARKDDILARDNEHRKREEEEKRRGRY
jgi:hypothetical protein